MAVAVPVEDILGRRNLICDEQNEMIMSEQSRRAKRLAVTSITVGLPGWGVYFYLSGTPLKMTIIAVGITLVVLTALTIITFRVLERRPDNNKGE